MVVKMDMKYEIDWVHSRLISFQLLSAVLIVTGTFNYKLQ